MHGRPRVGASSLCCSGVLKWAVPVLTGALVVVRVFAGEQQRSTAVLHGLRRRILG